ncbi:MAG TPA: hypothetical protein VH008_07240 [Pseudonocardia sp.]|nr:hypothetical protein [Pseudonocardia sp.]
MAEQAAEPHSSGADLDIAAVGALVAGPARCRMPLALADGRALPAGRLADDAGISAATAGRRVSAGSRVSAGRAPGFRFCGSRSSVIIRTSGLFSGLANSLLVLVIMEM